MRLALLLLVALILVGLSKASHARTLEDVYVQRLAHAKRRGEVERVREDYELRRMLRLACRLQIESHAIPAACYESLARESEWGLRTAAERLVLEHELDERCARAARALRASPADVNLLSRACRTRVEEAREIEKYRAQEEGTASAWSEN